MSACGRFGVWEKADLAAWLAHGAAGWAPLPVRRVDWNQVDWGQAEGSVRRLRQWIFAAFRPPAFASRVFLRPLGDSASLAVGLPGRTGLPDPTGVVTFRMAEIRSG